MKRTIYISSLLLVTALLAVMACNKTNPNTLTSSESSEVATATKNKVLYIIVDGAKGSEVESVSPPVLTGLTDHSIYSWDALSDYVNADVTNASAWTTLLTGVTSEKHGITESFATGDLEDYPTVFTRIKSQLTAARTVALTSSADLADSLAADATLSTSYAGSDLNTKNAAISELATADPDLLLVQFHEVDAAGLSDSYEASSATYSAAILQTDTYIGEVIDAVKARDTFEDENWLIVIVSNKGDNTEYVPSSASWSAFEDGRHNTFAFYYNPRFVTSKKVEPVGILPYAGDTPPYYVGGTSQPQNNGAYVSDSALGTLMDFGASTEFTMQCKVRVPSGSVVYYPSFLGKRAAFNTSTGSQGFLFFLESNYWGFNLRSTAPATSQALGTQINDGEWHTLTGVVRIEDGTRKAYAYTDGVVGGSATLVSTASYVSDSNFTVGWRTGSTYDSYVINGLLITDIRVYNTALPATYIANNYCATEVATTDEYYSNLVGFWPSTEVLTDASGVNYIEDKSAYGNKLIVKNTSTTSFSVTTANVCPPVSAASYKSVLNSVDALPLIYQWLGIHPSSSWSLDGQLWVPDYSDVTN
ncbi:MAG: DUF4983 domain-containing protein [Niabella sp.]